MKRQRKKTNRSNCVRVERYSCTENKDPSDIDGGWSAFRCLNIDIIAFHYAHLFRTVIIYLVHKQNAHIR